MRAACLSSETDEKLIDLVHKCEELHDISNKKCSDCMERKMWGQIGEELKK
jgi:hypothetical protein